MPTQSVYHRTEAVIRSFLNSLGRECGAINSSTNLCRGLGITSDEGVDLVLDLCEAFNLYLPEDFNAVVHDDGCRGRSMSELVSRIGTFVSEKEHVA